MRRGAYTCKFKGYNKMSEAYGQEMIYERHRHRYEFNNIYRKRFLEAGLEISGTSPDERLVEAIEVSSNNFHVGVQYHPEFKSRPNKAHPLFREFVKAALQIK